MRIKKIDREISLIKYRNLPLRAFDKDLDEEIYFYPAVFKSYWVKFDNELDIKNNKQLVIELTALFKNLQFDKIVIAKDINSSWIHSNFSLKQRCNEFVSAIKFLKKHRLDQDFNGSIVININDLTEFLNHFYILLLLDSSFGSFYFINEEQDILTFLHYSGDIKFEVLNSNIHNTFLNYLSKTNFNIITSLF